MTPNKAGHPMYDPGLDGSAQDGHYNKGKFVDAPSAVAWIPVDGPRPFLNRGRVGNSDLSTSIPRRV